MLNKLFRKSISRLPKHVSITVDNPLPQKNPTDSFARQKRVMDLLIKQQILHNIPIFSVLVLPFGTHDASTVNNLSEYFDKLSKQKILHENQVKISVLGKWYGLPGGLVESIKNLINETKEYDRFFFNFCVNYSGQEEIVDACRLIARKIQSGSIDIDSINRELIKENVYSSYFLAPDLLIMTGKKKTWPGLFIWDSAGAVYFHLDKSFNDINESDLLRAFSSI